MSEGVLFGSTGAHKELRRILLQNNRVEAVLSLPGGVFQPYSGVKTSVLVLRKGGRTERVMFLRADNDGWPTPADVQTVAAYIDQKRPVSVQDCFVTAPVKQFIDITISNLVPDTDEVKAQIQASIEAMLKAKAAPGQTIFAAWVSYAIMNAPGVESFQLTTDADYVMTSPGNMAVLGTIYYP